MLSCKVWHLLFKKKLYNLIFCHYFPLWEDSSRIMAWKIVSGSGNSSPAFVFIIQPLPPNATWPWCKLTWIPNQHGIAKLHNYAKTLSNVVGKTSSPARRVWSTYIPKITRCDSNNVGCSLFDYVTPWDKI